MQENTILGTLTLGGSDLLADLQNVNMRYVPKHNETKQLKSDGKKRQISKMAIQFTIDLFSTDTGDDVRIDFFNVTEFTIGGTDIRCDMYRFDIEGTFDRKPDPGFCSRWAKDANKAKDYTGTFEFGVKDAGYAAFMVAAASTDETDRRMTLHATINGIDTDIEVTLGDVEYSVPDADNHRIKVTVLGNAPSDLSQYPENPTGSATLLGWAFNAWKTTKAIVFKSNNTAAVGVHVTGNVTVSRFKFGAADGEVLITNYELESYGTMTVAATA